MHIIFGGPLGLTGSGSQLWSQSTPGVPGTAGDADEFGRVLVAADFGRNPSSGRVDDLAVISIWDVIDGTDLTGALTVLYGNHAGLTAKGEPSLGPSRLRTGDERLRLHARGDDLLVPAPGQ